MTISLHSHSVSVLVPTRNRPELLSKCLDSIVSQDYTPLEIIVGDDSDHEDSRVVIDALARSSPVKIIHLFNRPPLGQSRNVQELVEAASGQWLILIHDDDWLLPGAIGRLVRTAIENTQVDLVFGDQLVAAADGEIDATASQALNPAFFRRPHCAGQQSDSLWSAVMQQIPNNGYLIRRALAVKVGYHSGDIKDGCDYAFPVKIALAGAKVFYSPGFNAVYRRSHMSVSRGHSGGSMAFDMAAVNYKYRQKLPLTDAKLRSRVADHAYRAVLWAATQRRNRILALKYALNPSVGISYTPRNIASIILAYFAPALRMRIKRIYFKDIHRILDFER